jgi:hypothetical protein
MRWIDECCRNEDWLGQPTMGLDSRGWDPLTDWFSLPWICSLFHINLFLVVSSWFSHDFYTVGPCSYPSRKRIAALSLCLSIKANVERSDDVVPEATAESWWRWLYLLSLWSIHQFVVWWIPSLWNGWFHSWFIHWMLWCRMRRRYVRLLQLCHSRWLAFRSLPKFFVEKKWEYCRSHEVVAPNLPPWWLRSVDCCAWSCTDLQSVSTNCSFTTDCRI